MSEMRIRKRKTGASATLGRNGHPHLETPTGGELPVVTGASDPGFNPLDLLYASLAACMVLSARIAASEMGVLNRFEGVQAQVTGEKLEEEPSRITSFDVRLIISGDFDEDTKIAIAHRAEEICTVSNTLRGDARFTLAVE
ncbi:OsmC family protein [Rhizobium sp. CFBP 13717]|uniref:OsmC family protein n=2 Tax=unclassified Rhizobium TaxID=2613769 RepID=UPI001783EA23|nr:OsmC family protein [Rhizobium sp. CFBP 13644]MBD8693160.1 OsmC family protein [Rhizobium sp. CFBP 13717]